MQAPGGGQTESPGSTVAAAAGKPLRRIGRIASSHHSVHVGPGEARATQ